MEIEFVITNMKKLLALLLLSSFVLVSCAPKQYSFECFNGIYKVVMDDLKENITVSAPNKNYELIVPLSRTMKFDKGDLVYFFYYQDIQKTFSFQTRDNSMYLHGLRCEEV